MTKLDRYPTLFEMCKKTFPTGGLCFSDMSLSDLDAYALAIMEDMGGDSAKEAKRIKSITNSEDYEKASDDAISSVSLILDDFQRWYNDWAELERERYVNMDYSFSCPLQAMYDAGHKPSDF